MGHVERRGATTSAVAGLALVAVITGVGAGGLTPSAFAERLADIVPGDGVRRVIQAARDGDVAATTDALAALVGNVVTGAAGIAQDLAARAGEGAGGGGDGPATAGTEGGGVPGGGVPVGDVPADGEPCPLPTPGTAAAPTVDLHQHEAWGGHTLARHVGRSDEQLRQRLDGDARLSAASTFSDEVQATQVVGAAHVCVGDQHAAWMRAPAGRRPLVCDVLFARPTGRTLRRGAQAAEAATGARVVYQYAQHAAVGYRIRTAFPNPDVESMQCTS